MSCRKIRKLITQHSFDQISEKDQSILNQHLKHCQACNIYQEQLKQIKNSLEDLPRIPLPHQLERETLLQCRNELKKEAFSGKPLPRLFRITKVPVPIWGAIAALSLLTVIKVIPSFAELAGTDSLSPGAITSLILIGQNAFMLLISPLLIFKYGKKISSKVLMKNGF